MRHIIILIILLLSSSTSLCAQTDSDAVPFTVSNEANAPLTNNDYKNTHEWKVYKALNVTGWCALGVGIPTTVLGVTGLILYQLEADGGGPWTAVTVVGGTLTLSSIPLLIIANHYKKKAKMNNITVGLTELSAPALCTIHHPAPALSLTYNF